jgi:aspartate/methionine/tyrosine aminotransferase
MDKHEDNAKYNIAETCVASISLEELKSLSEDKQGEIWSPSTKMTYGAIRGSEKLRGNLANLYSAKKPFQADNVLITPGAIAANMTVFYGLIGKGDHVICHYPTYQQLYEVPRSLGAEVDLWHSREDRKWQLDIEELKGLIRPNTKMIIINNPHNPTGAIIPKSTLDALIDVAGEHNLIIHSDEVYRPLFHSISPSTPEFPPSILSLPYSRTIATGSLSKAYSLAGIRVGWIASRSPEIIEACAQARDYTTISVSQLDDQAAAYALSPDCIHALLGRNIQLAKRNLESLAKFIENHRWACDWVKPVAGTTAFIRFSKMGSEIDDVAFCETLMEETGVMLVPGSRCFGGGSEFNGFVRFGFCCETEVLEEGLDKLGMFMKTAYKKLPLAEEKEL